MDDIFHSAGIIDWTMLDWRLIFCITCFCRLYVWCISSKWWYFLIKGSPDPNHFIFEINIGMRRIRHTKTLKLNDEFLDRQKSIEDGVIQIQSRSMSDPLLSDIDFKNIMPWIYRLPLKFYLINIYGYSWIYFEHS